MYCVLPRISEVYAIAKRLQARSGTQFSEMISQYSILALCASCVYAQLVYPDQYERMRPATVPSYVYSSTRADRQMYANTTSQSNRHSSAQTSIQASAAAGPAPIPELPSTSAPGLFAWDEHVNGIIANGITKFALDVENAVYRNRLAVGGPLSALRENNVFSPLNVAMALTLVLLGSAGATFEEVARVLGLEAGVDVSKNSEVVHQMFGMLLDRVESNLTGLQAPRINFANGIFVQEGYPIRTVYKAVSERVYRSEVMNLNFQGSNDAQTTINSWVARKTLGKIAKILDKPPDPSTRVILVSALYFNGEWNQHFMNGATKRKPFFVEPNEAIEVDMMYNGGQFQFHEDKQMGAKIVRLPYKGQDTAMYVLLPVTPGAVGLREFLSRLTVTSVNTLIGNIKNETCIIGLPRMKFTNSLALREILQSLGVQSLFDPSTADLSLLAGWSLPQAENQGTKPPPQRREMAMRSPQSRSQLTNTNDLFVFPRFGETGEPTAGVTGGIRRNLFAYEDKARGLAVQQWATGFSITRVNGAPSIRRRRQARPMDQNFLRYLRGQQFPSYGLDDLRNSASLANPGLFASQVLHRVEIEVTERGTEAAATTAVILERDGHQKRLIANRPFVFFIRHDPTGLILFWATVNAPTPNYRVT